MAASIRHPSGKNDFLDEKHIPYSIRRRDKDLKRLRKEIKKANTEIKKQYGDYRRKFDEYYQWCAFKDIVRRDIIDFTLLSIGLQANLTSWMIKRYFRFSDKNILKDDRFFDCQFDHYFNGTNGRYPQNPTIKLPTTQNNSYILKEMAKDIGIMLGESSKNPQLDKINLKKTNGDEYSRQEKIAYVCLYLLEHDIGRIATWGDDVAQQLLDHFFKFNEDTTLEIILRFGLASMTDQHYS
jgi:hypothetical protein